MQHYDAEKHGYCITHKLNLRKFANKHRPILAISTDLYHKNSMIGLQNGPLKVTFKDCVRS